MAYDTKYSKKQPKPRIKEFAAGGVVSGKAADQQTDDMVAAVKSGKGTLSFSPNRKTSWGTK